MKAYRFHFTINRALTSLLLFSVFAIGVASANPARQDSVTTPQPLLLFEQNRGQFHEFVDYVARGKGYSIILGQQPLIELFRFKAVTGLENSDPDEGVQAQPEVGVYPSAHLRLPLTPEKQ